MNSDQRRVLLVLPQEILDRARVFAGEAMITLKLPVSLQIVFRVLIEHGLKRGGDRAVLAKVASEATAVHQRRSHADRTPARRRQPNRRAQPTVAIWKRGRGDSMVKWVAVTMWATIAAVAVGCAHPAPVLTTPAAPASARVAPGEARTNATGRDEMRHASDATRLKATVLYLYLLTRSQ
jgi:hypothetical protein